MPFSDVLFQHADKLCDFYKTKLREFHNLGSRDQKHKLDRRRCHEHLLPVKFRRIPFSKEEKSKMYQLIRDQGGHLGFPIGPKNT